MSPSEEIESSTSTGKILDRQFVQWTPNEGFELLIGGSVDRTFFGDVDAQGRLFGLVNDHHHGAAIHLRGQATRH